MPHFFLLPSNTHCGPILPFLCPPITWGFCLTITHFLCLPVLPCHSQSTCVFLSVVVTQRRPTKPPLVQHLITQKTTPAMSASSTTVPREASPTSSPEVPLTMISPSLSSLFTTSTSSASIPSSAVSSTRLRPSHPGKAPSCLSC